MTTTTAHPRAEAALTLRPGCPDDAAALSDLALRSKGWWGYSASFLAACRDELTLDTEQAQRCVLMRFGDQLAGFHLLGEPQRAAGPGRGEISMLFTDPEFIGAGVGRLLFEDAKTAGAQRGWTHLLIASDPHAVGFYCRLGAVPVGERLSGSIPGRSLPLLEVALPQRGAGGGGRFHASYWR